MELVKRGSIRFWIFAQEFSEGPPERALMLQRFVHFRCDVTNKGCDEGASAWTWKTNALLIARRPMMESNPGMMRLAAFEQTVTTEPVSLDMADTSAARR
jgi:hypothetical protein